MKLAILLLFVAAVLLMARFDVPRPAGRFAALRFWKP
jgi:hypothetical protein